jgi:hypothetical protein
MLGIQTCYNLLNSVCIDTIAEWYYDNLPQPLFGSLTLWVDHRAFDPKILQLDDNTKHEAIKILKKLKSSKFRPLTWTRYFDGHIDYINAPLDKEILLNKARNFVNGINAIDKARKTNFDSTFPELVDFRNNLKEIIKE